MNFKNDALGNSLPFNAFKKQGIMPEPGMQVNVDNMTGIIKTAAGGRCLVDFNHPLSGKDLVYTIKVNKIIEDEGISLLLNAKAAHFAAPGLDITKKVTAGLDAKN